MGVLMGFFRFLISISFVAPSLLSAGPKEILKIECYQNQGVIEVRPILDEWGIQLFREFPYLYVYEEETDYNTIFEIDPHAFVLFAVSDGKKIGVIQANPLSSPFLENELYTPYGSLDQVRKNGYDPDKILYISCFLMTKEERLNHDAIALLFDSAVGTAKKMGKTQICYMEIIQDAIHPLKPVSYVPLEPWSDLAMDYRDMGVQIEMSWPTLQPDGAVKEEAHAMALYIIDILE